MVSILVRLQSQNNRPGHGTSIIGADFTKFHRAFFSLSLPLGWLGLGVYRDVASKPAWADRGLDYGTLCTPSMLEVHNRAVLLLFRAEFLLRCFCGCSIVSLLGPQESPAVALGFWGACANDYARASPHEVGGALARGTSLPSGQMERSGPPLFQGKKMNCIKTRPPTSARPDILLFHARGRATPPSTAGAPPPRPGPPKRARLGPGPLSTRPTWTASLSGRGFPGSAFLRSVGPFYLPRVVPLRG